MADSPRVTRHSWGELVVDGVGRFKDAKLWPGGGRAWDWAETGTRHRPGVQSADVVELIDHGAQTVVLSLGRARVLVVQPSTVTYLTERGVHVVQAETGEAIEAYNRLAAEGQPVGALFHSTC